MNIKYNKKKEELRHDPVLESIAKTQQALKANSNRIISALIVIILILAGFQVMNYLGRKKLEGAQEGFGRGMLHLAAAEEDNALEAFSSVTDEFSNTAHGAYSAYLVGQIHLANGRYDEALASFESTVNNKNGKGFIQGEALIALATCYEAMGNDDLAMDYFNRALKDVSVRYRHPSVRWKMALLNKKNGNTEKAKTFCNELVSDTLSQDYGKKAEGLLAVLTHL